jgi:hypothetical protein
VGFDSVDSDVDDFAFVAPVPRSGTSVVEFVFEFTLRRRLGIPAGASGPLPIHFPNPRIINRRAIRRRHQMRRSCR